MRPDEADRRVLEEIQRDLPLAPRPFAALADRLALAPGELLARLRRHREGGLLRELSALLDGRRLGYRSTLVAAQAPAERVEELAARINAHPGVSHNYLRDHPWNLWFTLSVPGDRDPASEVSRLLGGGQVRRLLLPALRTYKLGVHLRFGDAEDGVWTTRPAEHGGPSAGASSDEPAEDPAPAALDGREKGVLAAVQAEVPLVDRPWRALAGPLGLAEGELLDCLRRLKLAGVIRRIAGVLRHRQAGFQANGMACFLLPEEEIDRAGGQAAGFPQVSHCYRRPTGPDWPYPLFAMVHARSREECSAVVEAIARRIGCADYRILYSIRELKKQRVRYLF